MSTTEQVGVDAVIITRAEYEGYTKNREKTPRSEVFTAIDAERNYQENKWGNKPSLETEFVIIQDYMETYRSKWVKERGNDAMKELMRIVATTAVRALENHGIVHRAK